MQPTFDQAYQMLNLAREAGVSLETLQALFATGLLSDLLKAENPTAVDREKFRILLGFDPSVFCVKMGGPETTDQITAALGFPFNEWVTQANFPLTPSEIPWEDEIEIIDPGCSFNEEEGLKFLADAKLGRPTYEHGLRFARQFGKTTTSEKKPYVIFLHESWQGPNRNRRVMCLYRNVKYPKLCLDYPDSRFSGHCVLAGVRPRKSSGS